MRMALASRSTADLARSMSLQTWTTLNTTSRPKIVPKGLSRPGDKRLKTWTRSLLASAIVIAKIPPAAE